jgi:hypothetical protein
MKRLFPPVDVFSGPVEDVSDQVKIKKGFTAYKLNDDLAKSVLTGKISCNNPGSRFERYRSFFSIALVAVNTMKITFLSQTEGKG